MPAGRPPVSATEIAEISSWIDAGCPEEEKLSSSVERLEYRIHPGIGVARVGSSPTEWFIGPEAPGVAPLPTGPFRDPQGLVKRQAARFRVYEYRFAADGRLAGVREITDADASVTWTVRSVNRKAEGELFPPGSGKRRNNKVQDRASLIIDSGSQSVVGADKSTAMVGKFRNREVPLGEIRTDEVGRLIVLGGFGESGYVGAGPRKITNFANNNDWHDDVSDGPVAATVKLPGREPVLADPAWVIVAPPKYAPEINSMMTLYDQALDAAARRNPGVAPATVSFTEHIYPILRRVCGLAWVNQHARRAHGEGGAQHFLEPDRLAALADPSDSGGGDERRFIFERLIPPRKPNSRRDPRNLMPLLNDGLDPEDPPNEIEAALTGLQYERMKKWSLGAFVNDWPGSPPEPQPFEALPVERQPAALDKAALEFCIGGPFFPGIEGGYLFARADTYRAPFRVKETFEAGALTANMALPWQADFLDCADEWWPAQRPNQVIRDGALVEWVPRSNTPRAPEPDKWGYLDMVDRWDQLGFVVKDGEAYVEKERLEGAPVA